MVAFFDVDREAVHLPYANADPMGPDGGGGAARRMVLGADGRLVMMR